MFTVGWCVKAIERLRRLTTALTPPKTCLSSAHIAGTKVMTTHARVARAVSGAGVACAHLAMRRIDAEWPWKKTSCGLVSPALKLTLRRSAQLDRVRDGAPDRACPVPNVVSYTPLQSRLQTKEGRPHGELSHNVRHCLQM